MVLGLVWIVFERIANRPAWAHIRLDLPRASGWQLALGRDHLPDGGPQQHLRPDGKQQRRRFPFCSPPRSVSRAEKGSGVSVTVESERGTSAACLRSGCENDKRVRIEKKKPAQRSRFFSERGHSCPLGVASRFARKADRNVGAPMSEV